MRPAGSEYRRRIWSRISLRLTKSGSRQKGIIANGCNGLFGCSVYNISMKQRHGSILAGIYSRRRDFVRTVSSKYDFYLQRNQSKQTNNIEIIQRYTLLIARRIVVVCSSGNFFFQSTNRVYLLFAVYKWYENPKNAQEIVYLVLSVRGLLCLGLFKTFFDVELSKGVFTKYCNSNPRDFVDLFFERPLIAKLPAFLCEEFDRCRCQKLLECLAPSEPFARPKGRLLCEFGPAIFFDIRQIYIVSNRILVPAKYGIDCGR